MFLMRADALRGEVGPPMQADALRGEVGPREIAQADRRVQFWAVQVNVA
jgi:hypothetical protein